MDITKGVEPTRIVSKITDASGRAFCVPCFAGEHVCDGEYSVLVANLSRQVVESATVECECPRASCVQRRAELAFWTPERVASMQVSLDYGWSVLGGKQFIPGVGWVPKTATGASS